MTNITNKRMMIFITALLACAILSINSIAASADISPSTITLAAYPGEIIQKNITITTNEIGMFNMTYNVSGNTSLIIVQYQTPVLVEKTKILPITFTFPADMQVPQSIKITFSTATEVADSVPVVSSGSSGSSGGGVLYKYWNGTNWTITKPTIVGGLPVLSEILNLASSENNTNFTVIQELNNPTASNEGFFLVRFWNWIKGLFGFK